MKSNAILFLHTVEPGLPSVIRIHHGFGFDLKTFRYRKHCLPPIRSCRCQKVRPRSHCWVVGSSFPRSRMTSVMTRGPFGSHSFIPFVASPFITDFGRFGQHTHDPTSVLAKAGSLGGASSSSSAAAGHVVQYSWYNRGDAN